MNNEKVLFEKKIIKWIKKFVHSLGDYKLIEIIEKNNLSKINSENIKK
jgi:hypothetical protein